MVGDLCAPEEYDRLIDHFEKKGFAVWLSALRRFMETGRDEPRRENAQGAAT
jgi:hypothetical protein